MSETIVILGAKRLRKEMKEAEMDLGDLRDIHMRAARTVATAAKPRTPNKTGALAKSVRPGASRSAGMVRAGNNGKVVYANPIHWGWPKRNIRPSLFLSDAASDTEPQWLQEYMQELDRIITELSGGPK